MSGIADQFETEPYASYTGSYVDNAIFGEMFSTGRTLDLGYTPFGISGSFNSRRLVSSKLGRNVTNYMNNAWMPGWLVNGYASGSFLGRPERFQRFFSDSEYFFDSFVPNPVEIHLNSGADLAGTALISAAEETVNEHSGAFYGLNSFPNTSIRAGSVAIYLKFLVYPAVAATVFAEVTSSWIDTKWGPSFPMESRYKNVERLFSFDGRLPRSYTISKLGDGGLMTPASSSNRIYAIGAIISGSRGGWGVYTVIGSLKRPTEAWPQSVSTYKFSNAMPRELTNTYFGFGDGVANNNTGGGYPSGQNFRGIPNARSLISREYVSDDAMVSHGVSPRGYRYGLKAPEPEHSSCVWRVGRFGQLRDMLEQRPFSKMRDVVGNQIGTDGPVKFVFLTGSAIYSQSLDYVTATNPSYNPRDSGAWDMEYKSGQPFADMDSVD